MPSAIELIVDGYVRLSNRPALEDLQTHRERLVADLKSRQSQGGAFDYSKSITQIEEEIAVIEAGLEKSRADSSSA